MLSRPPVRPISSRQNAVVKRFQHAARRRGSDDDVVLLEGARLVADAAAARVPITHIVFAPGAADEAMRRLFARLEDEGADVTSATSAVMAAVSPASTSSGVVALAKQPQHDLDALLRQSPRLLLLVVGVQDPGNVGALVRSAEAAGADGVVVSGISADPFGWKAIRGSMGSALRVPTLTATDPSQVIRLARDQRLRVIAAVPHGGTSLFDVSFLDPALLVLGGEGPGLSPELVALADERVTVPMSGEVESLNVGVAGALLLYEAFRQKGRLKPSTTAEGRRARLQPGLEP